jgi:hypothetical protein
MTHDQLVDKLRTGDHISDPSFLRAGHGGLQAMGLGQFVPGSKKSELKNYDQFPLELCFLTTDRYYKIFDEGNGKFQIGFLFRHNQKLEHSMKYGEALIPQAGQVLQVMDQGKTVHFYELTIYARIEGPIGPKGSSCLITGELLSKEIET